MAEEKAKPELKIRVGSVTATVWKNEREINGAKIDVMNTAIERSYKDKEDNWKTTNSFGLNDLPKVIAAATKAYEFIAVKEEKEEKKE